MEHSVSLDPDHPVLNWGLGYTYALMGRTDDAMRRSEWMQAHAPQTLYAVQLSSLLDGIAGRSEAALEKLTTVDLAPADGHVTFHFSESYAMAGDTAKALTLLERAVDRGMYPHKFYAEYCPFMAPLRGPSEFDRIVVKAAKRVAEFSA